MSHFPLAQEIVARIVAAGWSCSTNLARERFLNIVWKSTDTAPAKWRGQDIHHGLDLKHRDGQTADSIIADMTADFKHHSFDPITGKFSIGEVA